ncbi:MAG: leishmanolysin-related zinc metalloendopeptidase [Microthrixaceae bacterium]
MRSRPSPTLRALGLLVAVVATATACTAPAAPAPLPTTVPTTVPSGPAVIRFTATPPGPAPAVVAVSWQVAGPAGASLACSLDSDGDGTDDLTFACSDVGGRDITVPSPTTYSARLTVSDGTRRAVATTTVTATVPTVAAEPFDIQLRNQTALSPSMQAAFDAAAQRWGSILVQGLPAAAVNVAPGACGAPNGAVNQTVDDLVIDVWVGPIDGIGNVLGQAGPCAVGSQDRLPRFGVMQFDQADLADLATAGQLNDVILHEMGHVLGLGTRWTAKGVITGAGGADPRYVGPRGMAEYSALGRGGTVPVEAEGGVGTADSHWSEATFNNELMTGFLDPGANPLSRMSLASMADLGYQVDLGRADAYVLPGTAALVAARAAAAADPTPQPEVVPLDPVAVARQR